MKNWLIIQASKIKKWRSEKVLTLTITKLNELLMHSLVELVGPREALNRVFKGGMSLGNEFMMELSAHLETDIKRAPAYGEAAWMMFAGRKPTEQSFNKETIGDEEAWVYRLRDEDCPFCRNITFPHRFCQFPAGAYQGAGQTWSALTHQGKYHIICRETKCKAVGDPYCELTFLVIRREVPIEFLMQNRPELFEDVSIGFVEY